MMDFIDVKLRLEAQDHQSMLPHAQKYRARVEEINREIERHAGAVPAALKTFWNDFYSAIMRNPYFTGRPNTTLDTAVMLCLPLPPRTLGGRNQAEVMQKNHKLLLQALTVIEHARESLLQEVKKQYQASKDAKLQDLCRDIETL